MPSHLLILFSGLCGFLVCLLIVYLLYLMISTPSDDNDALIMSSLFQLIVLWVFVFGMAEVLVLALAHKVNEGMLEHRGMISQHILRARRIINGYEQPVIISGVQESKGGDSHVDSVKRLPSSSKEAIIDQIRLFVDTANDVVQTLEVMEDLWPAKVVGFKVEKEFLASACSAMLLFMVAVIDFCSFGSLSLVE